MSARYHVLVIDAGLLDELRATPPTGWHIGEHRTVRLPFSRYDVHEVEIEDDGAPSHLDGHLVEPILQENYDTGEVTVMTYRVIQTRSDKPRTCWTAAGHPEPECAGDLVGILWRCTHCGEAGAAWNCQRHMDAIVAHQIWPACKKCAQAGQPFRRLQLAPLGTPDDSPAWTTRPRTVTP